MLRTAAWWVANRDVALWCTNYATVTLITWSKGVSPVSNFNSYSSVVIKKKILIHHQPNKMAAHTDAAAYFFSRSVLCFLTFSICICVGVFSYCMLSRSYLQSSGTSEQTQGQLLQQGNIDWLPPSGKLPPAFWGAIIICAIIIRLILYLFIKSFLFCLRISYTF